MDRQLTERLGEAYVRQRLQMESVYPKSTVTFGRWKVHYETAQEILKWIGCAIKVCGLWPMGIRHSLNYHLCERKVTFDSLPGSFKGYRILHLSDIHIDALADRGKLLRERTRAIRADCCVITGDFCFKIGGDISDAMRCMETFLQDWHFKDGIHLVLGNHDQLAMVETLERAGVRVLMNESVCIKKGPERLWIVGVDDPHYYGLSDLRKALKAVPKEDFKVLLAHSPELWQEALDEGICLYLCGHAHGGQICLPGGRPLIANLKLPRRFYKGQWEAGPMKGYTSSGVGAAGLEVRFFSYPEITVHEMHPGHDSPNQE